MGHWVPMAAHQGGTVPVVALSPNFLEDRLAFAASNAGVFRSKDGGKSWELSGDGLNSFAAQSIAFSPRFSKDRTLFAGTADGSVYRSTDGGDEWSVLARIGAGSGVAALGVAEGAAGSLVVMAGTLADGVFVSTDRGNEWEPRNSGLPDLSVISLGLSPAYATDRTAFAATESGLQITTDGGGRWRQAWSDADDDTVQCMSMSPAFAADGTLFVGTEQHGVLRSPDRGKSWIPSNTGLPDPFVYALSLSPTFESDRTMVAATAGGFCRSTDGGQSWSLVAERQGITLSLATSAATAGAGSEQVILAGSAGAGVILSEDGGRSWRSSNQGLEAASLVSLALSPAFDSDDTIFACGPSDGVFRSDDGGQSWDPTWTGMEGVSATSLALSPFFSSDDTVYAGTSAGVLRSEDRGQSWHQLGLEDQSIGLMAVSRSQDKGTAIFAVAASGLHWSEDSGTNWQELPLPADEIPVALESSLDSAGEQSLLMATWRGPTDGGRGRLRVWVRTMADGSWNLRFSANSDASIAVLAVPDSFSREQKFFIGNGEAVYHIVPDTQERTREGVRPVWFARRVGERDRSVVSLMASPDFARSHTLIAACGEGVYLSEDDGIGWRRLGGSLGNRLPLAVAQSPDSGKSTSVYALTMGGRLWRWEPEER